MHWCSQPTLGGRERKVKNLLKFDIGELTIIPFGQSRESVLEMFAEGSMDKLRD